MDDEEFAKFVQSRGPSLLRTACFLTSDRRDGEDLLQQSLVNAYASFRRIREPRALEAYVRTTMARAAVSSRRKPWRLHERSTDSLPDTPHVDQAVNSDDRGELWPLLQRLSARQRAVVVLRYYEDLSEAEIATQLGCSTGSVKRHASRGLDHLRGFLGDQTATTRQGGESS